ncbi:pilus assembly PilX N-terminal domain-containing protein [Candidatus Nitrospira allomarina]|uniref:Pilus assembly PilX N-terminal domain-containing protein n=1 Tax=Candidatus Nitrospira allomarina TaxID=3020900 RepID=A0AA96GHP3_9BACT|nr:pilus assembly PilX N-terminal domain-containing protein [Candidatus Nitrospira allomarina]WNM58669.1 pilus assembly PilX N-terminal domain-containing protein [Candidatus Nitrospira allomarina]
MTGFNSKEGIRPYHNSMGGALITALLLVAFSTIMGATILFATSTDLQISGNFRRAMATFYAAEAGIAETAVRLGGSSLSNPGYLGDPSPILQANWSAYVLSLPEWKPQYDTEYSEVFTNYFPLSGNSTNTAVRPNSVQSILPYWTKIRHKTEYDAERAGHSSLTPHYQDGDGISATHSINNRGSLVFFGFASESELVPTSFTSVNPTPYSPIEIIISQGQAEGATSLIQVEVAHPSGPPLLAAVYAKNQVVFAGGTTAVEGFDNCGILAAGRPPVQLGPAGALAGTATFTGNPPTPQVGSEFLDLVKALESLKGGAQVISADLVGVNLGAPGHPALLYAESLAGGFPSRLAVQNLYGYGILLVAGNLSISAPFHWEGLIIVSGQVTFDGGIGSSVIQGALLAEQVQILNGEVKMTLDTCPIAASLRVLPVKTLSWQQLL